MPLNSEVLRNIDGLVRGGFDERDRIIEIFHEEMHEPGELDEAEVTAAVDAAFASLEKDKATWPRSISGFAAAQLIGKPPNIIGECCFDAPYFYYP
jgi:hypothetical protein